MTTQFPINAQLPVQGIKTDVLIVGAGPTGLMAAVTLVRYGINFCLIDEPPVRTQLGKASLLQPRTQEILQTMNLLHPLHTKGHQIPEMSFWTRKDDDNLVRSWIGPETVHNTPFPYVLNTHQGNTKETMESYLEAQGQKVFRSREFLAYEYNTDEWVGDWPLAVHVQNHISGVVETWYAKYILGTDGVESTVRKSIGTVSLVQPGDGDGYWAIADVSVDTNFPDIRRRCVIRSPWGGCMLIPRKDERVRVSFLMDEADLKVRPENSAALLKEKLSSVQLNALVQSRLESVLHPFQIKVTETAWLGQYRIKQCCTERFHDNGLHVFLLGDAAHTHIPKADLGMNLGIEDAYNLTWKLALCLKGITDPYLLLPTYDMERRTSAQRRIQQDGAFTRLFNEKDDLLSTDLQNLWTKGRDITSGCCLRYPGSFLTFPLPRLIIDSTAKYPLQVGKRLHPIDLIQHVDGKRVNLLDAMPSNGRFHIFVFVGVAVPSPAFVKLSRSLESLASPFNLYNDGGIGRFHHEDIYTDPIPGPNQSYVVDPFLVHSLSHLQLNLTNSPNPFHTLWSARVYEDPAGQGHADLGIDQNVGALVLVRPDGYISTITRLESLEDITVILARFVYSRVGGLSLDG